MLGTSDRPRDVAGQHLFMDRKDLSSREQITPVCAGRSIHSPMELREFFYLHPTRLGQAAVLAQAAAAAQFEPAVEPAGGGGAADRGGESRWRRTTFRAPFTSLQSAFSHPPPPDYPKTAVQKFTGCPEGGKATRQEVKGKGPRVPQHKEWRRRCGASKARGEVRLEWGKATKPQTAQHLSRWYHQHPKPKGRRSAFRRQRFHSPAGGERQERRSDECAACMPLCSAGARRRRPNKAPPAAAAAARMCARLLRRLLTAARAGAALRLAK